MDCRWLSGRFGGLRQRLVDQPGDRIDAGAIAFRCFGEAASKIGVAQKPLRGAPHQQMEVKVELGLGFRWYPGIKPIGQQMQLGQPETEAGHGEGSGDLSRRSGGFSLQA